jgi:hypothetical protein
MPDPSGLLCAIESDGRTADNPAAAPAASNGLRLILIFDIAVILSGPYIARVLNRVQRAIAAQAIREFA